MRHRRMVAPINTVKHYVHRSNTSVATGSLRQDDLVNAIIAPATANSFNVREGAIVKAIHLEYWINSDGATGTTVQFIVIVEKVPAGQAAVTAAQIVNLGAYPNKKNVFYTTQGNLGASVDGQSSVPLLRNWMLIPKGKQRMGLGDRIVITMHPIGSVGAAYCGLATYKEYV